MVNFYPKGEGCIRKIWNISMSVLLTAAIFLVIVFVVPGFLGFKSYVVTSGSMEPKYPVGSLILVKTVPAKDITVGDAITFYMKNTDIVATHQVYEIDKEQNVFRTQGINNRDSKGNILHDAAPVAFDSLIGKPVACIPYLGSVSRFCTATPNNYIVLGLAAAAAGISFVIDEIPEKESSPGTKRSWRKENEDKI